MNIETKLAEMGLTLPEPMQAPEGMRLPYAQVRVRGNRAYISGHGPLNADGSLPKPLGKVGAEVSLEQGYQAARLAALAMLSSLKRELGDLDRVTAWLRVFGMVNSAPAAFMRSYSRCTSSTKNMAAGWPCSNIACW